LSQVVWPDWRSVVIVSGFSQSAKKLKSGVDKRR
jgi:hypothetical protein